MKRRQNRNPVALGTGLIALDIVLGMQPTTQVRSQTGGTCGNVLSILSYLGWKTFPIARMNGDMASQYVKADMKRWGVSLEFASCDPTTHTPIIVQEIRKGRDGLPTHRFSWTCPKCGEWLPGFKAVTIEAIEAIEPKLPAAQVFFMDRLSRSAIMLAEKVSASGGLVVFEPSSKLDPKLLSDALRFTHIIKYADQRFSSVPGAMTAKDSTLIEIQTLGSRGLRFRHRLKSNKRSEWRHLDSVKAPHVADTCGSGDWCTAGFLSKIAKGGQKKLESATISQVENALKYGQALAAWNCAFEGARGGMYQVESDEFTKQVSSILSGKTRSLSFDTAIKIREADKALCPACPPTARRKRLATLARARSQQSSSGARKASR